VETLEIRTDAGLGKAIDEVRAYCEIVHEPPPARADEPMLATTVVRVWGVLEREASRLAVAEACATAAPILRRIARAIAALDVPGPRPEVLPVRAALYESRQQQGRDEVHVSVLFRTARDDTAFGRRLRARLKALGLGEGQWRPAGELRIG